jgi:hypothetical protein
MDFLRTQGLQLGRFSNLPIHIGSADQAKAPPQLAPQASRDFAVVMAQISVSRVFGVLSTYSIK